MSVIGSEFDFEINFAYKMGVQINKFQKKSHKKVLYQVKFDYYIGK